MLTLYNVISDFMQDMVNFVLSGKAEEHIYIFINYGLFCICFWLPHVVYFVFILEVIKLIYV